MFVSMPAAMPYVQSGRIRALAITGARRSTLIANMPTLAESGVRGSKSNRGSACSARRDYPRPSCASCTAT